VPQAALRYTMVSFSQDGVRVYFNGEIWASFPLAALQAGTWESVRFWGTGASGAVLLDLQLYDRALDHRAARKMALGLSC
jgi:hypothetical protein